MSEGKSSISKAETLEEIGEFWDTHDFTEFDTDRPDIEFTIASIVSVKHNLLERLEEPPESRD